jgi:VanZ family protein
MAYGLMTMLSFHSISGSRIIRILFSLLLIASLGLIDEGIQYFLPYRNASLTDWCFDIAAAVVVTFFLGLRHSES